MKALTDQLRLITTNKKKAELIGKKLEPQVAELLTSKMVLTTLQQQVDNVKD